MAGVRINQRHDWRKSELFEGRIGRVQNQQEYESILPISTKMRLAKVRIN